MNEMMILAQTGVSETGCGHPVLNKTCWSFWYLSSCLAWALASRPKTSVWPFAEPWGLVIGWVTQFGLMPLITVGLIALLLLQLPLEYAAPVAVGALLMGALPAGTTSNIFTNFSKGNLALSVMMTTHSTLWGAVDDSGTARPLRSVAVCRPERIPDPTSQHQL